MAGNDEERRETRSQALDEPAAAPEAGYRARQSWPGNTTRGGLERPRRRTRQTPRRRSGCSRTTVRCGPSPPAAGRRENAPCAVVLTRRADLLTCSMMPWTSSDELPAATRHDLPRRSAIQQGRNRRPHTPRRAGRRPARASTYASAICRIPPLSERAIRAGAALRS